MSEIDYKQLARAMMGELQGTKYKAAVGVPTAVMGHGPAGLFSNPALEKPVFSAMMLPAKGLQSILPTKPSQFTNPLYGIFTGVTGTTGSEPTAPCDDPPYAGLSKLCMFTAPFGRYSRMTRVFELDAFGKLRDRGDHMDLELMNDPFGDDKSPMSPSALGGGNPLQSDIVKGLFEFGVAFSRDFARQIWSGNPANNTASNGYMEFRGLDLCINTGYRDAISGVACPASDSYIQSFGNLNVAAVPATMVDNISWIMHELNDRASRTELDPVEWVMTMRPSLFYLITAGWPCSYLTNRCVTAVGAEATVNSTEAVAMRDEMRTGSFLWVDGVKVSVVQDDTIVETNIGAGVYSSGIYFVPLTVLGKTPVTYMEYFDYSTPQGFSAAANEFAAQGFFDVSDNGRFAWHKKPPNNWCVQMLAKTEPRLVLHTPFLAARLTNIRYTPGIHVRDWDVSGTYFVNGGTSGGQPAPSYYTPTA